MVLLIVLWSWLGTATNSVEILNLEELQELTIKPDSDTLYVVNFWATWCKPCVAEMPYFEEANKKFAAQKVKVIFVSLNYPRESTAVGNFIKQKGIHTDCYLLDAGNPNVWIDQIEKEWGGSIPATIMYKNGVKVFFLEREFAQTELDSIIQTKIQ